MGKVPAAVFAALIGATIVAPAAAQFGSIFGEPPRPPSAVPGGQQQQGNPPQGNYPPQSNYPPARNTQPATQGSIQQRPLQPPPGGGPVVEPAARGPVAPPPRQRGPQPVDTSPQPGDEVIAEPPSQKIANNAALFSGLDKITGRIINFDVSIGETVQFGALQLTPRACYTRPPTETANTDSFIEVDEVTLQGEVRRIFTGWVFAASPGLHAVEHPIYDIWLTDCKGPAATAEQKPPEATPAAATPPRTQPKQLPKRQPTAQQQI